jgi:hypothetical protein
MSALGHKRTRRDVGAASALPPKADTTQRDGASALGQKQTSRMDPCQALDVRFTPKIGRSTRGFASRFVIALHSHSLDRTSLGADPDRNSASWLLPAARLKGRLS